MFVVIVMVMVVVVIVLVDEHALSPLFKRVHFNDSQAV